MTGFLDLFIMHAQQIWSSHYVLLAAMSILLALMLRNAVPGMMAFVIRMLLLFILLLAGGAVAAGMGSADLASVLHGLGVLILGVLLIRQFCLVFFRLIVPRMGLRPPRILEEILILLAYGAWILVRLSLAGLDLGSLVASTAVITAVLAFAMQDTLGNILAGLALQLDHSVHIGDWIDIDGVNGQVVQVQWRHTAVRTLFGEMVLIPNSQLMKARVMLTGGPSVPHRLRTVLFYAAFDLRPAIVIQEVEQVLAQAEFEMIATTPKPVCVVTDFAGGVMTYAVRYWLTDPRRPGQGDSLVRQHIHAVFQRYGWKMASPGMDLTLNPRASEMRHPDGVAADNIESRLRVLRATQLFTPLTDDELHDVAHQLRHVHYVAGSLLARQGEVGECLFIVLNGQTAIWLEAHGNRHLLAEPGPGEVIGEMSLMTGEPRRATITARTDLDCYILDKAGFQMILQQRPELAEAFAQLLALRNQELAALRDNVPATPMAIEKAALLGRIRSLFRI